MSAEEVWHNIRRADGSWDGFAVLDRSSSQFTKRNMASAVVNGEEVLAYQSFHSPLAMKTYIRTRHADGTWSLGGSTERGRHPVRSASSRRLAPC